MKNKKIDLKDARCEKLTITTPITLRKEQGAEQGVTGFEIEAYTGAVVERFWGRFAIAIDGIAASQQMPIFLGHNSSKIVGYSTSTDKDGGSFSLTGIFSSVTAAAREVKALAVEGFPWQASIGVAPKTVLEIKEGAQMLVNGRELRGPAEVWLESEVYETSFVPLGADSNTGVSVFERENLQEKRAKKPSATKEKCMDLATLKKDHPELLAEFREELLAALTAETLAADHLELASELMAKGAEAERQRIKEVRAQLMKGHEALIEKLAVDGTSTGADAAMAIVAAEKAAREKTEAALAAEGNPPVPPSRENERPSTIPREEFNKYSPADQRDFIQQGGKVR